MENEQRGRAFRASSTSSLGREVRCGCQFYQSDSLLPERCTLVGRPPSKLMMQTPPPHIRVDHHCENEYEPIASPHSPPATSMVAPVVRIMDTDVTPVADSDDSIDDRGRFNLRLTLDGDIILPLDGKIEDDAMAGPELGETVDTFDEMESEQLNEQLDDNFARLTEPNMEIKIAEETIPDQVVEPVNEDLQKKQTNHGLQEKLRNQADKLSSRLRSFQRPSFTIPARCKFIKRKSSPKSVVESENTKKVSKMERFKMSLPERPRFLFSGTSKLSLKKHPKLNIKAPKMRLPTAIKCTHKHTPSMQEQQKQQSTKSSYGSQKNIFSHFPACQKILDWKVKNKGEYATSSPKETRAQVIESSTYPRTKNNFKYQESQEFEDKLFDEKTAIERIRPWRHASLEEPRLAFRIQASESLEESNKLPWETEQKIFIDQEEIQFADYEECSQEQIGKIENEIETEKVEDDDDSYYNNEEREEEKLSVLRLKRMENLTNNDNNDFGDSINISYDENSLSPSNIEQQSSGSSCDKRGRGIIQETDLENFSYFADDNHGNFDNPKYFGRNLEELQENTYSKSLTDIDVPPQRPKRSKSIKSKKDQFLDSFTYLQPMHQENEQILHCSDISLEQLNRRDSFSNAHRIIYRAETISREQSPIDYLDDIVILKPTRKKSKSSLFRQTETHLNSTQNFLDSNLVELVSPTAPSRRKRNRNQNRNGNTEIDVEHVIISTVYNGRNQNLGNFLHDEISPNNSLMILTVNTEGKSFLQSIESEMFQEPPVPPKRRSRSRTASIIQDENLSLQDIDSIPGIDFADCDIAHDDIHGQLTNYAIIEKREKLSLSPPPRRRRRKSATYSRPISPKVPQRTYRTIVPVKKSLTETENQIESSEYVSEYANIDSDEENKSLRSKFLNKVQSRPLPAPPRPPRLHRLSRNNGEYYEPETVRETNETVASTQTDPLPDDEVIDEEITQAKLVMTPSRCGSQILISTERIPTPTLLQTPSIPQILDQTQENTDSIKPKNISPGEDEMIPDPNDILRTALLSEEPIRINNLEVRDLRVDRLSVSQLEAFKIAASEIEAIVVSATEISREESLKESGINPALLQELIAIKNHLENVTQFQEKTRSRTEDASTATSIEEVNIISGNLKEQDNVLVSTIQEVKSTTETESGNVKIMESKINDIEEMVQSTIHTNSLQNQILQVENLKPETEIEADVGCTTSRETFEENHEKLCQEIKASIRSSAQLGDQDSKQIPSLTKSITPVTNTLELQPTLEISPQKTITLHVKGRESTFETSQIPAQFFSLATPISQPIETEISLTEITLQLFRAIRIVGTRNLRHFVNYIASKVDREEATDKIRDIELVLCALLLIVAGLLIMLIGRPSTITYHHHWDYFNPPQ